MDKDCLNYKFIIAVIIYTAIFTCIYASLVKAEEVDLAIIAQIESNNNPKAIGKAGEIGLYQISTIALRTFNYWLEATGREKLTRQDLFNPVINKMIAETFFDLFIPHWLADYGKPNTIENKIIAWNAGMRAIQKGYIPKVTRNYIKKYYKLSKELK